MANTEPLRRIVRGILSEDADKEYGSQAHISMLESTLEHLTRLRETHGRQSRTRYIMSRAIDEVRRELRRARKHGERMGYLQRLDEE